MPFFYPYLARLKPNERDRDSGFSQSDRNGDQSDPDDNGDQGGDNGGDNGGSLHLLCRCFPWK